MPWKKGQSGNPKGRPKRGKTLAETLRALMDAERDHPLKPGERATGWELLVESTLIHAINGDPTAQRICWTYLDGLPAQRLEHSGPGGRAIPHVVVTAELDDMIRGTEEPSKALQEILNADE